MVNKISKDRPNNDGEFLWLISLSDLMILLFVFFVVLFSFSYSKMTPKDFEKMKSVIKGERGDNTLDAIQKHLLKWVVNKKLLKSISIIQKEDSLILNIKEKILFDPGEYAIKENSYELIILIGQALEQIPSPYRIGIEGHTDDIPVKGTKFDGNWELSSMRALSVLKAFKFSFQIQNRVVLMSYGSSKPIVSNRDRQGRPIMENQARNRRVTIRIF